MKKHLATPPQHPCREFADVGQQGAAATRVTDVPVATLQVRDGYDWLTVINKMPAIRATTPH